MGPDAIILVFWMLSFEPTFSLSSFTFIKRLFSSSSLSALRMVSSAYLKLLTFIWQSWIQLVLLPAQCSSWCTLHIIVVNKALFVLIFFFKLTTGRYLNKSRKAFRRNEGHFSSSAHLVPRQVNKTMEIWETNLTGKGVCLYFPRWIQRTHMASS